MPVPVYKVFLTLLKIWSKSIQISMNERETKPENNHMIRLVGITAYTMSTEEFDDLSSYAVRAVGMFDHIFDLIIKALDNHTTKVL